MPYKPRVSNFHSLGLFCPTLEKCVSVKSDALRTCRCRDADRPADLAADVEPTGSPGRRLVRKYRVIGHLSVFDENARLRRREWNRKNQAHTFAPDRDIFPDFQEFKVFRMEWECGNTGCESVLCADCSPTESSKLGQNLMDMEGNLLYEIAMEEIPSQKDTEKRPFSCYLRKGPRDFPGETKNDG